LKGALFLGEISNAPMNLRFNLRSLGLEFTKIYDLTEWTFFGKINYFKNIVFIPICFFIQIVLYVIARGLLVPYLVFHTVTSSLCPLIVKICCIGVFTQSIFFLFVYGDMINIIIWVIFWWLFDFLIRNIFFKYGLFFTTQISW